MEQCWFKARHPWRVGGGRFSSGSAQALGSHVPVGLAPPRGREGLPPSPDNGHLLCVCGGGGGEGGQAGRGRGCGAGFPGNSLNPQGMRLHKPRASAWLAGLPVLGLSCGGGCLSVIPLQPEGEGGVGCGEGGQRAWEREAYWDTPVREGGLSQPLRGDSVWGQVGRRGATDRLRAPLCFFRCPRTSGPLWTKRSWWTPWRERSTPTGSR